jgi:hypothetical protein
MIKLCHMKIAIITAVIISITSCKSTSDAPQVSPDGMQLKVSSRSTVTYEKEGVNFSEYNKVLILPSQIAFKSNWQSDFNRNRISLSTRLTDKDVLRIKEDVAQLFDEVFPEEFSKGNENILVDKPTTGVLIMKPTIIDLDVNPSNTKSTSNNRTFVHTAGQATLFLELYDSVSGEILARFIDTAIIGDNHYTHQANRVSNITEGERTIRGWGKALRVKYEAIQH